MIQTAFFRQYGLSRKTILPNCRRFRQKASVTRSF
jgi:hypothetical protein